MDGSPSCPTFICSGLALSVSRGPSKTFLLATYDTRSCLFSALEAAIFFDASHAAEAKKMMPMMAKAANTASVVALALPSHLTQWPKVSLWCSGLHTSQNGPVCPGRHCASAMYPE